MEKKKLPECWCCGKETDCVYSMCSDDEELCPECYAKLLNGDIIQYDDKYVPLNEITDKKELQILYKLVSKIRFDVVSLQNQSLTCCFCGKTGAKYRKASESNICDECDAKLEVVMENIDNNKVQE
ncbi:MAG: hypothetical protein ACOCWG_04035 [bacterium]